MPPFPDGWFQVAYSAEVSVGDVRPLEYFGTDLVLFRTSSGEATVLDAHCPHLGAHLGYGGCLEDDSIVCPFHAWRFDATGACSGIPYSDKIPKRARLKKWAVQEVNGLIMVWFHAQGEPPSWEVPTLVEYDNDEWTPYSLTSWKIRAHNQEMAENAVDAAHFLYLHGTQGMPTTHAEIHEHVLHVKSQTKMRAYGTTVNGAIEVLAHGFGFTTTRFTGIVETLLVNSVTPIDGEYVDCRFAFTIRKGPNEQVTQIVALKFQEEIKRQLEADIQIWENKVYLPSPMLVKGDGPIGIYRKWVKRFYSEPASP
jgi:phenylpropionate dioxygenase-like ring-hydroxylating dioxygenase large terminal subunit